MPPLNTVFSIVCNLTERKTRLQVVIRANIEANENQYDRARLDHLPGNFIILQVAAWILGPKIAGQLLRTHPGIAVADGLIMT